MDSLAGVVSIPLLLVLASYLAYSSQVNLKSTTDGRRLPPGPTPLPVLGSVHELPSQHQERTFAEWGRKYGDVVFAKLFQTPALVLNSLQAAQDLLEKRSSKYSDRPRFVLVGELMGWDVITHMNNDDRFRRQRRWMHGVFGEKDVLKSYFALQRRETYVLVSGFIDTPDEFISHIKRFAAALMMEVAYGHLVKSLDDEYVRIADDATTATVEGGTPASMVVDFFPWLTHLPTWMPGSAFRKEAARIRVLVQRLMDTPFDMVKRTMAAGTATPSLTQALLEQTQSLEGGTTNQDEIDIKVAAGALYGAGTDTTVAVLGTFILAMLSHPHVYKKAQEEMSCIIKEGQLPEFDDRPHLPYLECIFKEILRWNCPLPLGMPHKTQVEDEYRGYDIPAETMVIPVIWSMSRDPDAYPDPETFRPERFQEMDAMTADLTDPRKYVFGFGRRLCPGWKFADQGIWFAMATIVATLDLTNAVDASGARIPVEPKFTSGFVSHPIPFKCTIRPRSKDLADLIMQMRISTSPH